MIGLTKERGILQIRYQADPNNSQDRKIGVNTAWNSFSEKNLQCFTVWNKDEVKNRQDLLFNLAKQIWNVSV